MRRRRRRLTRRATVVAAVATLAAGTLAAGQADAKPKTFTVKNGHDNGDGSFRRALERAGNHRGPDRIVLSRSLRKPIVVRRDLEGRGGLRIVGRGRQRPAIVARKGDRHSLPSLSFETPPHERVVLDRLRVRSLGISADARMDVRDSRFTAPGPKAGTGLLLLEGGSLVHSRVSGWREGFDSYEGQGVRVANSVITGNSTGARFDYSTGTIEHSTIARNGRGIMIGNPSSVKVVESQITGNDQAGGIAAYYYAHVDVIRSTVARNESASGGGIAVGDAGAEIVNSTISGNRAVGDEDTQGRGGGVYSPYSAQIRVEASTITGNSAQQGGGIAARDSAVKITVGSSIEAGNEAATGDDCTIFDVSGQVSPMSRGGNVFGTAGCGPGHRASDALTAHPGLGPLEMNGGPTATHALRKGSPAIGNALEPGPRTDQRGVKRGKNPDSGSFERR